MYLAGSQKTKKVMIVTLAVLFCCLAIFLITLVSISPGKPRPYLDQEENLVSGSISEKVFVKIGGVKQGMFIRGRDLRNPVLLFVHGGPSFPEFFLVEKYPTGLEDSFTVCYWEERGGGISFTPQVSLESMTLEQLVSDLIEVTNFLRERFSKEKIYLMAHSGGTAFAIQAAASSPRLFQAYIGIAQISKQAESEKTAYTYMLNRYIETGNSKMVSEFNKYPLIGNDSYILPFFKSMLRDKAMHELGIGTMKNMKSIFKEIFLAVWLCRAYTLKEKFNIWVSKMTFINKSGLRDQIISTDFTRIVQEINIPVYFFSGEYDFTVNYELSKEYLTRIKAPVKGFYTFHNSAHSPMFEEPQVLYDIMVEDVLNNTATLADK